MKLHLPNAWADLLAAEINAPYFQQLTAFVAQERAQHTVFPPESQVFSALEVLPPEAVRVVILGQDPYHGAGQAHGLSFSVAEGTKPPPSLVNMFKELKSDLGIDRGKNGHLLGWAQQGVLLLNAVLTVREGQANSHKNQGWEKFTDGVLYALSHQASPMVFVLWGAYAQKKIRFIDTTRHLVLQTAHPSPLSAHNGFFGSRPFSKINQQLLAWQYSPIDWLA
jgi:uracil-DNA glycosylase